MVGKRAATLLPDEPPPRGNAPPVREATVPSQNHSVEEGPPRLASHALRGNLELGSDWLNPTIARHGRHGNETEPEDPAFCARLWRGVFANAFL